MKKQTWTLMKNPAQTKLLSREDICAGSARLAVAFDHLTVTWLGVDKLIRSLQDSLSVGVLVKDKPVVLQVMKDSVEAYMTSLDDSDLTKHHQRMQRFLAACIESARHHASFQVVDPDSQNTWTVLSDQPLAEWLAGRSHVTIEDSSTDPAELTVGLYEKFIPRNLKLAMRRFQHESSIMGLCVDTCD